MNVKAKSLSETEVELSELFCPNCGKQEVYIEAGEGDYYQGPGHYCKSCNAEFTIATFRVNETIEFSE